MDNFQLQTFFPFLFFFCDTVHVQVLFWLMKTSFSKFQLSDVRVGILNVMKAEALALQDI